MTHLFLLAGHGHIDFSAFTIWEWVMIGASCLVVAWSIWRAVALTMYPGETDPAHIKRAILHEPRGLEVDVSSTSSAPPRQSGGGEN